MNAPPEIVAAIQAKYPKKAVEAARSCVVHGDPIPVPGGAHQKYRLSDGTIAVLDWSPPPPPAVPVKKEKAISVIEQARREVDLLTPGSAPIAAGASA